MLQRYVGRPLKKVERWRSKAEDVGLNPTKHNSPEKFKLATPLYNADLGGIVLRGKHGRRLIN